MTIAFTLGLALVYIKLSKKTTKNYKIAGFLSVLVMILSMFAVLQMNVNPTNTGEDIIHVNDAADITDSSVVLSCEINDLDGDGPLFLLGEHVRVMAVAALEL